MFLQQKNQLLLVHDKLCLVSHWPVAFQFEILMSTFVDLRVVAGGSRTWAGRSQAVRETADVNSHMSCRAHAALCHCL